jgi:hypothetical protein
MFRLSAACCRAAVLLLLLLSGAHAFQLQLPRSVAATRPTAFAGEVHRHTRVASSAPIAGSATRCLLSTTTSSRGGVTRIFSKSRPDEAVSSPSLLPTKVTRNDRWLASALRTATPIAASTWAVWTATISAAIAAAASDEVEMAELPPPYVPAVFAVVLLGGVGWFTASLGNVMDEEASLGLQSGAKAKKEMERSRSSYFKKK